MTEKIWRLEKQWAEGREATPSLCKKERGSSLCLRPHDRPAQSRAYLGVAYACVLESGG